MVCGVRSRSDAAANHNTPLPSSAMECTVASRRLTGSGVRHKDGVKCAKPSKVPTQKPPFGEARLVPAGCGAHRSELARDEDFILAGRQGTRDVAETVRRGIAFLPGEHFPVRAQYEPGDSMRRGNPEVERKAGLEAAECADTAVACEPHAGPAAGLGLIIGDPIAKEHRTPSRPAGAAASISSPGASLSTIFH